VTLRAGRSVKIYQAESAQLVQELPLPAIVEVNFSPRGTYISTWERPGLPLPPRLFPARADPTQ
jgi:uncharacterized protein with WD repeat